MDFLNDLIIDDDNCICYWAGEWLDIAFNLPPEIDFLDSNEE